MKKILNAALVALVLNTLMPAGIYAQDAFAVVRGAINPSFRGTVVLTRIIHGETVRYEAAINPSSGSFAFAVPLTGNEWERVAVIRDNGRHSKKAMETMLTFPLYLRPRETCGFTFAVGAKRLGYVLAKPSPENKTLQEWANLSNEWVPGVNAEGMSARDLVQRYKSMRTKVQEFVKSVDVRGNPEFTRAMRALAQAGYEFAPLEFVAGKKPDTSSDDYRLLKPLLQAAYTNLEKFDNAAILDAGEGRSMVKYYDALYAGRPLATAIGLIRNDTLKGYYLCEKLANLSRMPVDSFDAVVAPFTRYLVTREMQQAVANKRLALADGGHRSANGGGWAVTTTEFSDHTMDESALHDNTDLAYVTGFCEPDNWPGEEIKITRAGSNGGEEPVGVTRMTGRRFHILIPVEKEGAYQLQCKGFVGRVYLKPADRLSITIGRTRAAAADKDQSTYVYHVDGGSAENKLLEEWYLLSLPLTTKGYYKQLYTADSAGMNAYAGQYARVLTAAADFRNRIHTGNTRFDAWMSLVVDADLAVSPLKYLAEMDNRNPGRMAGRLRGKLDLPVFINQSLSSSNVFEHADLLRLQGAAEWLELYAHAKLAALPGEQRRQMDQAARVAFMVTASGNDTIRGCLLGLQLHNLEALDVNNLSEFRAVVEPLQKYTVYNSEALNGYNALYQTYVQDTAIIGHPVNDISLPDNTGRQVNLRGFKGKVVVIDTWATWCGPCKAQIPFLKEVEEAYAGNPDVVFISLSVDRQADEGKWKSMVIQLDLKGIQLIDYSGKTFAWPYGIMAIPRFLVMDKHGVWVEIRCPMPDDTEKFKSYIEKALK